MGPGKKNGAGEQSPGIGARTPRSKSTIAGWLVAPWLLTVVVVTAVALARKKPIGILGTVLGLLLGVPILWIFVSALWPRGVERTCPVCKQDRLRRASPDSTIGLVCTACGWSDETESSWFIAEEEGPLEEIVLAQRRERKAARAARRDSAVDSAGSRD